MLLSEEQEVLVKLVLGCDDDTVSRGVELRSSCSTEYLKYVQNTNINKLSFTSVVILRSWDNKEL